MIGNEISLLEPCRWTHPPTEIRIRPGNVHLWLAAIVQSAGDLESLWNLLSDEEKSRANNIPKEKRNCFVASRGILRLILGRYLKGEPSKIQFSYRGEKPSLTQEFQELGIKFNLSHSGDLAVYAVALSQEVGVDLQQVCSTPQADHIATRFFTNEEKEMLSKLAGNRKQLAFFRIWTRKEAYLKGKGLSLTKILDKSGKSLETESWCFRSLEPARGYVATLAVPDRVKKLYFWKWAQ